MERWRGKWALVTGASAGIGWAFATELATGGTNLVLAARRRERLEQLATQLRNNCRVRVEVVVADLAQPAACEQIFTCTQNKGIAVELLIDNAGFGAHGEFHQIPLARQLEMVQVNVAAIVHLTHLYLPQMIQRRRGDILIVSSVAGFQAVPYSATYAATKAFDLLFAEALAEEVRRYGVRVCALCPGSTTSEFHEVAGQPRRTGQRSEPAEKVARVGLQALTRGKSYIISGAGNYLRTHSERLVPRRFVTRVAALMQRPTD